MSPAYPITQSPQEIKHNLGTEDVAIHVWVNGYAVQPDARIQDENTVVVGLAQPFSNAKAIIEPASKAEPVHKPVKESSDADKTRGEGDSSSDESGGGTPGKGRSRR